MYRFRASIRTKLTAAAMIPLMTAIAICWVIGASVITTRFSSQALQSVTSNLNSAHEIFLAEQARLTEIIRLTGQSPELAAACGDSSVRSGFPTLLPILRNERLSFLTVVDRFGFVRFRAANPGLTGDSMAGEKPVSDALKGALSGGVTILAPAQAYRENPLLPSLMTLKLKATPHGRSYLKSVEDQGLFQVAATPVKSEDGTVIGAVYGGILLNGDNRLVERITHVLFPRDGMEAGNATLFMNDVRIATTVIDEARKPAIGTLMSEEVYSSISGGKTWVGTAFVLNSHYFTAYEPLRDLRGGIAGALYVGIPEQPLLNLRRQVNLVFFVMLLSVTVVGVGFSAWIGANLSRPIRALEEGARRIASGEDLPDIAVESLDEIGSLAGEFNVMKRRLMERDEENELLNRTLEQKVVERTLQLEDKSRQLLNTQQELAKAERLADIGVLASGVAHEINNPLAIIRGNAELLEMDRRVGDSVQPEIETIINQVSRVERIVANLLTFARAQKKTAKPFLIETLLDDILAQVGHQIPMGPYSVERNYRLSGIPFSGDEDQLRQVFTNLIVNGLQAMESGGTLALTTGFDDGGGSFCVTIGDEGSGIDAETQNKLFTPFFTTKARGTGLGLAVSYGIVRNHGGDIKVVSEVGKGARFIVVLPVRQMEA